MVVTVEPHNPRWIRSFEETAAELRALLGGNVVAVHHIGSTAIPSAWAKPIVDLLVVVRDLSEMDRSKENLIAAGYEPMGEYGISGRRYFRRSDAAGMRTHHVHAYEIESPEIDRHLTFRDYLLAHPDEARQYSELKRRLAHRHPEDSAQYSAGKASLIAELQGRAVSWRSQSSA